MSNNESVPSLKEMKDLITKYQEMIEHLPSMIAELPIKQTDIVKGMGISYQSYNKKMKAVDRMNPKEVVKIIDVIEAEIQKRISYMNEIIKD
ncbi:hypothetical protein [Persicobacter psychrovividus]|uniref:Uncharacterized protein n=1 Tax=Persicobacter psychrovividus TaxID=387638 RepID=A0ABN6LF25_9BACT|nr:hypothetical protein PEPS_39800 [Persicobacter psychrovividus]